MASDYKVFLEEWTVRDVVNHLRPTGPKYRIVLNEAVGKVNGPTRNGTRVPMMSLVGVVPDKILFAIYENYREVN